MDSLSIVLLVVACVMTIALIIVLLRNKQNNNKAYDHTYYDLQLKVTQLEEAKAQLETQFRTNEDCKLELEERIRRLNQAHEEELRKATLQIKTLEKEISQALEKGTDEVARQRLDEANKLILRVEELELCLEEARIELEKFNKQENEIDRFKKRTIELEDELEKAKRESLVIHSLKKRVSELEDDLEDATDEIEDEKNKNRKLQVAFNDLQNELDSEQRNSNRIKKDYEETKQRLADLQNQYNLRVEALDFVTEVLTARTTNDESVTKLYKDVEATVDLIKGEVRDILKETKSLTQDAEQKFFGSALDSWAIAKKKTWIQGKVTIAFVGEFSAGKTSIVNRILSQDNPNVPRLPVSTKATTAIPTYITGGLGTYYQFVTPNNELKRISEDTFKRVNKEVLDKVKGVSSMIKYFVMTYKNPYLEKMSILDTPGFSSNDKDDEDRTIGVINECDALFWVFDVNAGTVNRTSLKIIKKHLSKPLYIVINQIDTKNKRDVDAVENLIRKELAEEGVAFKGIVRFSHKEPLSVMMKAINEVSHDSNRELLLDDLVDFVEVKSKESVKRTNNTLQRSNSCQSKQEYLNQQFQWELHLLRDNCEDVGAIPQFNSRWFSADDYRISEEQYEEFGNLLNIISTERTDNLINLNNAQIDAVSALEAAWKEHSEARNIQTSLQGCLEKLEKKRRLFLSKKNTINSGATHSQYQSSGGKYNNSNNNQYKKEEGARSSFDVAEFESIFRWAIIEKQGASVLLNWDKVRDILNKTLKKEFSRNAIRKSIPHFGVHDYVKTDEIVRQIERLMKS